MELISTGRYSTWKLPKNTSIAITSNPDNGDYSVNSLDTAQRTRFVNFHVKKDIEGWARWAEKNSIDSRAINFALRYPEIFDKKNSRGEQILNPRSYVTFCKAIGGLKDWSKTKSLELIFTVANGCFNDEDEVLAGMFTTFINNGLDKIPSPKEIMFDRWTDVKQKLKDAIYNSDNEYQPAVGTIIATRMLNYACYCFDEKKVKTELIEKRIVDMVESDVPLLTEDHLFHIINHLVSSYKGRCNNLLMNSKISSRLTV